MLSLTKKEIDNIFKIGSRTRTQYFDFILAPKTHEIGKVLVVTSRKIGNAPKRNQIRRRIKSIFFEEKLFTLQYDCIIIVKPNFGNLFFQDIRKIILQTIQ